MTCCVEAPAASTVNLLYHRLLVAMLLKMSADLSSNSWNVEFVCVAPFKHI